TGGARVRRLFWRLHPRSWFGNSHRRSDHGGRGGFCSVQRERFLGLYMGLEQSVESIRGRRRGRRPGGRRFLSLHDLHVGLGGRHPRQGGEFGGGGGPEHSSHSRRERERTA